MTFDRSPMRMLAMKQFSEQFGDLLGVRASVGEHERLMVEHVYEQLFFLETAAKKAWDRRVRAAYHFLDRGSLENARGVAERFLNCGELVGMAMNAAMDSKRDARDINGEVDAEALIRRKLTYYKDLVEGPYRVLLAPVAYAFAKALHNLDKSFLPGEDGKAKLAVLPKIERLSVYPQSQLSQGVNTHVRNACAHSNFRITDSEHVELWDPDPHKPGKQWGPETWPVDKIDTLADDLEITNLALLHALTIYAINNRMLIQARGWMRTLSRPKLTQKELRVSVEHVAGGLGFRPKVFKIENNDIAIEFDTNFPGRSQDEEIVMGGKNWGRRLTQRVEYVDVPIIEQLLHLFQQTYSWWEHYGRVTVAVNDHEGKRIGDVAIDSSAMGRFADGPSDLPVAAARQLCAVDTLGAATMNVRIEHTPTG